MPVAKGYQSYRGRRSKSRTLTVVLLVLILAAACVFLFAQRYVVYRDDGSWYFDIPFFSQSDGDGSSSGGDSQGGSGGVNLVVDPGGGDGGNTDQTPTDLPYGERHLIPLTALPADAEALNAALSQAGANGFVYTVRDDTGRVFYDSPIAQEKAAQREVSKESLSALCAGEDTVAVARFNCFHDSYYASVHKAEAGICQANGSIWGDEKNYYWLDPAKELARQYVIQLAQECAQMGFDELLLEEMCYPAGGRQEKIDYSGNTVDKSQALVQFLQELRTALADYGTKLSLLVTEDLLRAGSNGVSGQNMAALLPLVDALYVPTEDATAVRTLLVQLAGEGDVPALVPVTAQAGQGNWCLTEG